MTQMYLHKAGTPRCGRGYFVIGETMSTAEKLMSILDLTLLLNKSRSDERYLPIFLSRPLDNSLR